MSLTITHTQDSDVILSNFLNYTEETGLQLYPAQEEAILHIMAGEHVILNTPTGSGKSLVATAMHYKGLCEGKRSFYTCPIKALVSEKFFALCDMFGAENVGMMTGDASINKEANVICCTAEILSQIALSEGDKANVGYVIMDEFHYFSDKERGVHWQIPLLTLPQSTFLLMSATLGDTTHIEDAILRLTHKPPKLVISAHRPVPLDYSYAETPLHETLYNLISSHRYPVYVVNFTQAACAQEAQNAMSVNFCTKEEKKAIQEAIAHFRFDTPYGKDMKRFLSHGVGLHHAGLLPKYRLLVEKLAQEGYLKVIMGTDTLGVGVNVPIRTVLFTKLCKFDGDKTGILSIRDFKQISGRAGRKGFDDEGSVVCQAPEHVIDNKRAEARYAADAKKSKKPVKAAAPTKNYVHWDDKTFQRLIEQPPEPLRSQFELTHAMVLAALQSNLGQGKEGYRRLINIIHRSLETPHSKRQLRKKACLLLKSLITAQIVSVVTNRLTGPRLVVNETLQQDFSLHHTLSLFILQALPLLPPEPENTTYALDVLSLVESVIEHPKIILQKQIDKLKTEKMASLKAEGVEYDARIEELEKVEHPKPLRDFIYQIFNEFRSLHPWVQETNILPKSVAREMVEQSASFHQYISQYGLQKSEGILLRYLSSAYKALVQSVPETNKTESIYDTEAFFRSLLARVDTSLISEWEQMLQPVVSQPGHSIAVAKLPFDPTVNMKAFRARVRAEMHALLGSLARREYAEALLVICNEPQDTWNEAKLERALAPFYEEHDKIVFDHAARSPTLTLIEETESLCYRVRQVISDPAEHNDWFIEAIVDMNQVSSASDKLLKLESIGS